MKKRLTEDEKILKGIEKNFIRTRELNNKRAKELKRKQIISAVLGSAATIGFFFGIGFFLAIVEHMSF